MPAMTRMLTFALNDNAAANARQVLYIYKNVLGGELDISSVFVCMQKLSLGMHVSRPDVMGSNRRFTGCVCARLQSQAGTALFACARKLHNRTLTSPFLF